MNHVYKLVFNRELGVIQVASELAASAVGGACSNEGVRTATVSWLRFAMWAVLGWVGFVTPAFAQDAGRIIGDPTAGQHRPGVLEAPNGVPLIQIATPNASGLSHNRFSQMDVGSQGAIWSNNRTQVQTELGGWVQGNPRLASGAAKVILNEVNGPASQLNGYMEVAGQRADVIVANPAGISVSGGFINANRVTLTTGVPVFAGGSLDHYRVEGGAITVHGAGLDTSRAGYTDLIARSLQVNADVLANQLQATLGTNTVSADHTQVTPTATGSSAPQFALDVSGLGGMFANKIFLVGTEHGVGVRNAGTIGAQAGDLVVTVDGRLENASGGALQSKQNAYISASGGAANAGTITAARELVLSTSADVDNSGGQLNAGRIEVNAQSLRNRDGAIQQTGLQALAMNAGTLTNRDGGRIGVAAPITGGGDGGSSGGGSTGGSDPVSGGASGGQDGGGSTGGGTLPPPELLADGALNIAGTLSNDDGKINAGGGIDLASTQGMNNDGGHIGLRQLTLNGGDLGNAGGELTVTGATTLHVGQVNNDGGQLKLAGELTFDAQNFSNRAGTLSHSGTDATALQVADAIDNTGGKIASNASALTLDSAVLVNEGGRIEQTAATA